MICFFDKTTGVAKRFVTCPDNEIVYNLCEGEDYLTVDAAPSAGNWRVENGVLVLVPEPVVTVPYTAQRAVAYPSIGNQLDALWHAMNAGLLPMVPAFFDPIKAVKDAIPKAE